jgi:hypothetical protein
MLHPIQKNRTLTILSQPKNIILEHRPLEHLALLVTIELDQILLPIDLLNATRLKRHPCRATLGPDNDVAVSIKTHPLINPTDSNLIQSRTAQQLCSVLQNEQISTQLPTTLPDDCQPLAIAHARHIGSLFVIC